MFCFPNAVHLVIPEGIQLLLNCYLLHVHRYAEVMIAKKKYSVENIMWSVLRKQNVLAEEVCERDVYLSRIEKSSPSPPLLTLPL